MCLEWGMVCILEVNEFVSQKGLGEFSGTGYNQNMEGLRFIDLKCCFFCIKSSNLLGSCCPEEQGVGRGGGEALWKSGHIKSHFPIGSHTLAM